MRAQEQILENAYHQKPGYWEAYAEEIGGIEVCDDETGEVKFTIGTNELTGEWRYWRIKIRRWINDTTFEKLV